MFSAIAQRARYQASHSQFRNAGNRYSSREAPTIFASAETISLANRPAVNGRRDITMQVSSVQYLPDDGKLVVPAELFTVDNVNMSQVGAHAVGCYHTVRRLCGLPEEDSEHAFEDFVNARPTSADHWAGHPTHWNAGLEKGQTNWHIVITSLVGIFAEDGSIVRRRSVDEYAEAYLQVQYGPNDGDVVVFGAPLAVGVVSPGTIEDCVKLDDINQQLGDYMSAACQWNISLFDFGKLARQEMRWSDDMVQAAQDAIRFRPSFSPYTLSSIAALNLPAVNNIPICAWVRSYGLACGLLPDDMSKHNLEYQLTVQPAEDAELKEVALAHDEGEDGQRFLRGCMSVIAAFGALHLANDHTYKGTDQDLLRKARVFVQCCRTTFTEDQMQTITGDTVLQTVIRTTCHPFGLSSTLGVFYNGKRLGFLAEPLRIRSAVVPPPIAKVGLVVAMMDKMFALPVGGLLRNQYQTQYNALQQLKTNVVNRAANYSALHRHYGYDTLATLGSDDEQTANDLMPLVSAYAEIFERDEDGNPIGAALSQIVRKCLREQAALCNLYMSAFQQYVSKSTDLKALITGSSAAPAAAPAAAP
jgi:hypothetical protein